MLFRLREILLSKNIPFNTFAYRMGVTPSSLAVTERFYPSISTVQKCADLLGMPAWELVYDCGVEMVTPYMRPADDPSIEDKVEQRLQTLMAKRNLSYRRLAALMGVTGAALTQSVKRRKLSLKTVENMATGLGVEPWQLLATPEEVRGEVLRRKAALGIEEEPEPTPEAPAQSAKAGRYVAVPLLPNGSPDLSKLEWIDTPEGRVLAWAMSEVRIIELGADAAVPEPEEEAEVLQLTGDR